MSLTHKSSFLWLLFLWWPIMWIMVAKYPSQGSALWAFSGTLIGVSFLVKYPISVIFWIIAFIMFILGGYFLFILKHNPDLPPGYGELIIPDDNTKKDVLS